MPQKKLKSFEDDDTECLWIQFDNIRLMVSDKEIVLGGLQLHDMHIDLYQRLLKSHFPLLNGLSSTLNVAPVGKWIENYVQVYHCRNNHWITASTIGCKDREVNVYDSLYTVLDSATKTKIEKAFPDSNMRTILPPVQKQDGVKDCGLFAVAFATFLAFGNSPQSLSLHHFDQNKLRLHYVSCLEQQIVTEFPSN